MACPVCGSEIFQDRMLFSYRCGGCGNIYNHGELIEQQKKECTELTGDY
jgi:DNA-directed RNA polymerase subunit RPC12/RpoP